MDGKKGDEWMKETKQNSQKLNVNWDFAKLASEEQIERAASALEANGIKTLIAEHGEEAEKMLFDLITFLHWR